MLQEFKEFLLKTNALALAIGVIIGAASGSVVKAITTDLIAPIIGALTPGTADWKTAGFALKHDAKTNAPTDVIAYGDFINEVLSFIIIAFVVFIIAKILIKPDPAAPTKDCPFCKETVPIDATRCKACTSELTAA